MMTMLVSFSAHWRARKLQTKHNADFYAALASGTAWTFVVNSLFLLMCLCKMFVGGDDIAVDTDYNSERK